MAEVGAAAEDSPTTAPMMARVKRCHLPALRTFLGMRRRARRVVIALAALVVAMVVVAWEPVRKDDGDTR